MDSRYKPRKTTWWERQLGASSSTYNDDSMTSMVGGIGGVPSRVPGARHEQSNFENYNPPRLPQVYRTDGIGLLHGNFDYLQVARYSLKDKTSEVGRFATFSNPKKRNL